MVKKGIRTTTKQRHKRDTSIETACDVAGEREREGEDELELDAGGAGDGAVDAADDEDVEEEREGARHELQAHEVPHAACRERNHRARAALAGALVAHFSLRVVSRSFTSLVQKKPLPRVSHGGRGSTPRGQRTGLPGLLPGLAAGATLQSVLHSALLPAAVVEIVVSVVVSAVVSAVAAA